MKIAIKPAYSNGVPGEGTRLVEDGDPTADHLVCYTGGKIQESKLDEFMEDDVDEFFVNAEDYVPLVKVPATAMVMNTTNILRNGEAKADSELVTLTRSGETSTETPAANTTLAPTKALSKSAAKRADKAKAAGSGH